MLENDLMNLNKNAPNMSIKHSFDIF